MAEVFIVSLLQTFYSLIVIKPKFLLVGIKSTLSKYFHLQSIFPWSSPQANSLGVFLNSSLLFQLHISNIDHLCPSLTERTVFLLIHSLTTPKFLHMLQHISAPHTITRTSSIHHITRPSATPPAPGQIPKSIQNPTIYIYGHP